MYKKLQWDALNKKYTEVSVPVTQRSVEMPAAQAFTSNELLKSIAIDDESEKSGDEGDYKYSETDLDEEIASITKGKRRCTTPVDDMPMKRMSIKRPVVKHNPTKEKLTYLKTKLAYCLAMLCDIEHEL